MPINNIHEATEILRKLADRIDPYTGKIYPPDSPYECIQLASALYIALEFLDENLPKKVRSKCKRKLRKRRVKKPPLKEKSYHPENAGRVWGEEESKLLVESFNSGIPIAIIAKIYRRTENAIAARLVRLGRVSSRDEARIGIRDKE